MAAPGALMDFITGEASRLGFDDVGCCSVEPFTMWRDRAYEALLARLKHDALLLMPEAQTIVVAVKRYSVYGQWPKDTAAVAHYYVSSNTGFSRIRELAARLADRGWQAIANPQLPAKQAALRAGLGVQGMNTQLCHHTFGSLVSLHMILTDAPLPVCDKVPSGCARCGICASSCPAGAIYESGFDHERCLRMHMVSGEVIPLWAREPMGTQLVGCTDCQHACPHAHIAPVEVPADLARACGIAGLLEGSRIQLDALAGYIGENFARPMRIRQQAAICAGNSGDRAYVPRLADLLDEKDIVLRCHAAWALGRLGGLEARTALDGALRSEREKAVKHEIEQALFSASLDR